MNLTQQDIKNLLALIAIAPIKGAEALTVVALQEKLNEMLETNEKKNEKKSG